MRVELILNNEELDLAMREADVAIRLRRPAQPDLIQRRLFTIHFHVYASNDYLKRFGEPTTLADLDKHRIVSFGGAGALLPAGRALALDGGARRRWSRANTTTWSTTSRR